MAQKTFATGLEADILRSMLRKAERTAQRIKEISGNLSAEKEALRRAVAEYSARRAEFVVQELGERGLTWCTLCSKAVPVSETELLFTEGKERYSCGYENSCYGFSDFAHLHRACPACRERAADRHGQVGRYDSLAENQTFFYAFRAEKREDGYYARKFGNWVKLDDKHRKLNDPPNELIEKLAEEWNFPPKIELAARVPGRELDDEIVIHERAASAAK